MPRPENPPPPARHRSPAPSPFSSLDPAVFDRLRRPLLALLCLLFATLAVRAEPSPPRDATALHRWVLASGDHHGRPFAIVDKRAARLQVFDASGRLVGATPVLLGLTPGDEALVTELGTRPVASLTPQERTTPAGRFDAEPGLNDRGEPIVWLDYDAALAIHRLRPALARERRAERLASADPAQRRISAGCVVVPVAFFEDVIAPTLGRVRSTVYVLPEAGTPAGSIPVASR